MTVEREIKIAVESLDSVRERLMSQGATLAAAVALETNWVWDRGDEILAQGCLLRLREDGQGARLTFKGQVSFSGPDKVRDEIEIGVSDFSVAAELLRRLGYERRTGYQKYREEWRVGDSLVALDRTPIGCFVEIEGGDTAGEAERLGLDPSTAERLSYLGLWEAYRREHPDAPTEMSFP